jgi:predicted O-linked N-acetylglucosamine transferase (SPINDLY family)
MLKNLLASLLGRGAARVPRAAASDDLELAVNLLLQGDDTGAAQICEQRLQRDPESVKAWELSGAAALNLCDYPAACERFERVLALAGDDPQHLANAAEANRRADRCGRALDLIESALALQPVQASFLHIRVLALEGCWRMDEALAACREALVLHPDFGKLHTSYMRLLNCAGADPALILDAHCEWARRFAGTPEAVLQHANPPQPGRQLRIGYVSADFRQHAASDFILPLLEHHDRTQFEVYCYSNTPKADAITRRCEDLASHWRDIAMTSDAAADTLMRADGIDLLIDLSGHTAGNRLPLFARKPAPVQITFLGYPGTTGLAQMDYRLTDGFADPSGSDAHYREKLLRLPHSLWCFQPPQSMPQPGPAPFLRCGRITLGSLNSTSKLTPRTIALWSRLLQQLPGTRLLMAGVSTVEARERIMAEFAQHGVAPHSLSIHPGLEREEFWTLHQNIDIALDSFPYNGGATTCATLWLGVPVISMAGNLFQSRAGLSILAAVGLRDLVADNPDDFLRIALELARDPQRLAELRSGMRGRMRASPLLEAAAYTRDLEHMYHAAWKQWCGDRPAGRGGVC